MSFIMHIMIALFPMKISQVLIYVTHFKITRQIMLKSHI